MNFPDNKFDYFTVTVDTLGQASKNTFSVYLNEPLKNVVQAKLLSTHIHTSDAVQHLYVDIDELKTMFSERASAEYNGANEISGSPVKWTSWAPIATNLWIAVELILI